MSRPRAWLMLLAFGLILGALAERADAQAFRPRSRTGIAKATPKKGTATAAATPATAKAPATAPRKAPAPAKPAVAKKAPPKKKGKGDDDDDVVVVDDDEDE